MQRARDIYEKEQSLGQQRAQALDAQVNRAGVVDPDNSSVEETMIAQMQSQGIVIEMQDVMRSAERAF